MNKVFKVIWNEARNAYVVVSEIAKNHGSKSCSTKKLLAMLIATGVMTCASFDVLAAEPSGTDTAKSQYVAFADPTHTLYSGNKTTIDEHEYIYDATNNIGCVKAINWWLKKHTPLSDHGKSSDVAYIGNGDKDSILQSVASMVSASGTVTNMGESLNKITASGFVGVSHSGGTAADGTWHYIIHDPTWEGAVAQGNYEDGYVDLVGKNMPKGFVTADDNKGLIWDDDKQAYNYKGKPVDYSNVYVIDGKIGVFTNKDGSDFYEGTVFGKNNEILMTVKDDNGHFYSYWASAVTDPSATMSTYRLAEYKKDLSVLVENDEKLSRNDIKEVTLDTTQANSATIGLLRNGDTEAGAPVKGAITVTSGGGTDGSGAANDTFVKISNGTANQTFATGSKVEVNGPANAITGIKVNGVDYTIKQGSGVKVEQDATKKTTTITVDGTATTITDNDTTYTAGDGIEISSANAISVSKNLIGMESIQGAGEGKISFDGDNVKVNNTTFGENSVVVGVAGDGKHPVRIDGETGRITGLANTKVGYTDFANDKGTAATEGQLKQVMDEGWKFTTDSNEKTTVKVGPDGTNDNAVTFKGDGTNIAVTNTGKDIKVALKKDLTVDSVKAGDFFMDKNKGVGYVDKAYITSSGLNANNQKITGVADGINDTDAVNVSQLKNSAWKLAANGVLTEAEDVKAGDYVDFNGDQNVSVSKDAKDGVKTVKVELNKDLKNIETISNGDAKLTLGGFTTELTNGQGASVKLFGDTTTINNAVTVYKDGRIAGVAAGINDNDAVNVSQLKAVGATANMGWSRATNGVATEATNVKPGDYVDFSGDKNISVSHDGTKVQVKLNENIDVNSVQTNALNSKYNLSVGTMAENGIMPFFVNSTGDFYAAHNKFHVDKDGKVTATAGEIGNVVLQNGVYYGHSTLQDGSLLLTDDNGNHSYIDAKSAKLGKVTVTEDGKITGVAAGAITADSTDAVNGSQLHAVATEAGKHSKVVSGNNINVEETDVDGQKFYKVNMNKDIILGDLTGKYVNISGTNGTIEATGAIATNDRVYADKGAKLADIDVTGDKISNGASSIVLDGSNVKVNDKVTIDQNGKISGVAAGEVSNTSTDAINGSQLHQTNENVAANRADIDKNKADIAALDNRVTKNEQDIKQNAADIAQNKADIATNKADIATNKADIATNKANIAQNAADIKKVEELAKKHTTVTAGDNIIVTEDTNKDGGKEYNVALKNKIDLGDNGSVTTGQTVMNNDGLKVGKDVSVTATAVTAGKTSISDEGVKVGDKTYISDKGLNANDQKVTNVAAGELSETSKDAVNGSQLYKTNQEVVNNTNRINKLGSRVNKVGAGAAALAALHPMDFDPDDKLTFSAGYGNYAGENAAAIGAYYRPDEKVMFSVAGTVGNGENMVNAGVSFALDRTNHVSNSRTALAREVIDLRGQLAVMGAKMAKMEKAFGMLDETKTKLFPDVPANHWAYEYIAKLAGNGYIEGYPDGNFGGDRLMTRYEFAAMLYRAIENGAALEEKIIKEFEPELGRIRVDRISGEDGDRDKIERVRVNDTKGERDHYGNKLAK